MSSDVQFDEDKFSYGRPVRPQGSGGYGHPQAPSAVPKMAQWLMNKGIVNSPSGAQGLLIGFIIVNLVITYIIMTYLR